MKNNTINNNIPAIAFKLYLQDTKQEASQKTYSKMMALPISELMQLHDKALKIVNIGKIENK